MYVRFAELPVFDFTALAAAFRGKEPDPQTRRSRARNARFASGKANKRLVGLLAWAAQPRK